jgi:hypothetical protein
MFNYWRICGVLSDIALRLSSRNTLPVKSTSSR